MASRPALPLLSALLLSACAQGSFGVSPGTVLSSIILAGEKTSAPARVPASRAPTATAARVLNGAEQYLGVKYTWGGNTPQSGFDCSGFTKYVFARQGISLPRTSRDQARAGQRVAVDLRALQPGDLLFFAEPGEAISHVAIFAGNGRIIQSSAGFGGVNYLDLNSGYGDWYLQNLVAVRRVM